MQHEWHAPAPPVPANALTGDTGWFWLRLFTSAERGRWNLILRHAATLTVAQLLADPWIYGVVNTDRDLNHARTINLNEAPVIAGVTGLCRHTFVIDSVNVTVLESDARRDEVLAGVVVA